MYLLNHSVFTASLQYFSVIFSNIDETYHGSLTYLIPSFLIISSKSLNTGTLLSTSNKTTP